MLQVNGFLLLSVVRRFAAGRDVVQFQDVTVVRYHIVNLERVASVIYDLRLMNIQTSQLKMKKSDNWNIQRLGYYLYISSIQINWIITEFMKVSGLIGNLRNGWNPLLLWRHNRFQEFVKRLDRPVVTETIHNNIANFPTYTIFLGATFSPSNRFLMKRLTVAEVRGLAGSRVGCNKWNGRRLR